MKGAMGDTLEHWAGNKEIGIVPIATLNYAQDPKPGDALSAITRKLRNSCALVIQWKAFLER